MTREALAIFVLVPGAGGSAYWFPVNGFINVGLHCGPKGR
ncbi:hypothetical protein BH24ACT5_BH24ACT5_13600 [soil metagenome]